MLSTHATPGVENHWWFSTHRPLTPSESSGIARLRYPARPMPHPGLRFSTPSRIVTREPRELPCEYWRYEPGARTEVGKENEPEDDAARGPPPARQADGQSVSDCRNLVKRNTARMFRTWPNSVSYPHHPAYLTAHIVP